MPRRIQPSGRFRRQAVVFDTTVSTKRPKNSPFLRIQKNQGMIERGKVLGTINKVEEKSDQSVENLTIVLPEKKASEEINGLAGTDWDPAKANTSPVEIRLRLEPSLGQQAMTIQSASVVDGKINGDLLTFLKTIFSGKDVIHNNTSILEKDEGSAVRTEPIIAYTSWPDISRDHAKLRTSGSFPDAEMKEGLLARHPMLKLDTLEPSTRMEIETMPPDDVVGIMDSGRNQGWSNEGGPVVEVAGDSLWSTYPLPTEVNTITSAGNLTSSTPTGEFLKTLML